MKFQSFRKTAWLEREDQFQNLWHHNLAIHILTNTTRSEGNQAMKFGQLTKHNMRNIFLEKSYTLKILFQDPSVKNQNWACLWISSVKVYTACFYFIPGWGLSKYNETNLQTTCFYLIWNLFKKQNVSCYIILLHQFSLSGCIYFLRYRAICAL